MSNQTVENNNSVQAGQAEAKQLMAVAQELGDSRAFGELMAKQQYVLALYELRELFHKAAKRAAFEFVPQTDELLESCDSVADMMRIATDTKRVKFQTWNEDKDDPNWRQHSEFITPSLEAEKPEIGLSEVTFACLHLHNQLDLWAYHTMLQLVDPEGHVWPEGNLVKFRDRMTEIVERG